MPRTNFRQMICTATHELLIDWAVVVKDRTPQGHCRSMEHHYRPVLLRGDEEEDRRAPVRIIDAHAAVTIERVVASPVFPVFNRQFLKAHYIYQAKPPLICRFIGVRFRDFDEQWYRSVLIVRNRLQLIEKRHAPQFHGGNGAVNK